MLRIKGEEYAASVFKEFNIYALIRGKTKSFHFRTDRNHQLIKVLSMAGRQRMLSKAHLEAWIPKVFLFVCFPLSS